LILAAARSAATEGARKRILAARSRQPAAGTAPAADIDSLQTPHLRATDARSRGIRFPTSLSVTSQGHIGGGQTRPQCRARRVPFPAFDIRGPISRAGGLHGVCRPGPPRWHSFAVGAMERGVLRPSSPTGTHSPATHGRGPAGRACNGSSVGRCRSHRSQPDEDSVEPGHPDEPEQRPAPWRGEALPQQNIFMAVMDKLQPKPVRPVGRPPAKEST